MGENSRWGDAVQCRGVFNPVVEAFAPPASKSVAARALILAGLATGPSRLGNLPQAQDTQDLVVCLRMAGLRIESGSEPDAIVVHGGFLVPSDPSVALPVGEGGTTLRFLVPWLCGIPGEHRLRLAPGLARRPHRPLLDQAEALGTTITMDGQYTWRLRVPTSLSSAPTLHVDTRVSSQFLSGWLLRAVGWPGGMTLQTPAERVSDGYLAQTAAVMRAFGVEPPDIVGNPIVIPAAPVTPANMRIPADASAAVYAWGAAAISGGTVTTTGIDARIPQPDLRVLPALTALGCTVDATANTISVKGPADGGWTGSLDHDLRECPDGAVMLAFLCAWGNRTHRLRGLGILRHKESDRLAVIAQSLFVLGATVDSHADGWTITGSSSLRPAHIDPAGDHRIAMAAAVLGMRVPGLVVQNPACVGKSWPGFWERYEAWQRA